MLAAGPDFSKHLNKQNTTALFSTPQSAARNKSHLLFGSVRMSTHQHRHISVSQI